MTPRLTVTPRLPDGRAKTGGRSALGLTLIGHARAMMELEGRHITLSRARVMPCILRASWLGTEMRTVSVQIR